MTTSQEHEGQITSIKKHSFNRNPSIEKIIKFNAYICSQNFFILPAILAWMKTSVLQSYSEKWTTFVKILTIATIRVTEEIYKNPSKTFGFSTKIKRKMLEISSYTALFLVFLQLGTCVAFLGMNSLPGGLIFMLAAISYISYLNYLCLRLIIFKQKHKDEHEKDFENEATTKYIRPKDILGKRTISSLNLF